jgi:predicted NBD/HSP70 family sugar kinase
MRKLKSQIASSSTIRNINRQIVLSHVRQLGTTSRAEIAKLTDLQRSTVSIIIDELINDGFLEEIGSGESTGGRKPTMLRLQRGKAAVIGIDITPTFTNIASADLAGNLLQKESFITSPKMEETFANILLNLKKITDNCDTTDIEVGISVPGLVDELHQTVIYVPFFNWENWKFGEEFYKATNLNSVIDNDANSTALAELWFGRPEVHQMKNFMTIMVAEGIGTGIVFDGTVYRGENGVAGEFGHMIVGAESDVICSCGNRKCWESFASDRATIARYKKLSKEASLREMREIVDLVSQGNEHAIAAVNETIEYLGIGISNLLVGLNPQAVFISGSISRYWELISSELHKIAARSVRRDLPKSFLMASSLGENPSLVGALSLVLAKKFAAKT